MTYSFNIIPYDNWIRDYKLQANKDIYLISQTLCSVEKARHKAHMGGSVG